MGPEGEKKKGSLMMVREKEPGVTRL